MTNRSPRIVGEPSAQGDVLLVPVECVPGSASEVTADGPATLALGEATGHHHSIYDRVRMFRDDGGGGGTYVAVPPGADVLLKHQEHDPVPLRAGTVYRVVLQRTFSAGVAARVED